MIYDYSMRQIFYVFSLMMAFAVVHMPVAAWSMQAEISIVVNDDAISELEINDRMKLLMSSTGIPETAENKERIRPQVKQMLIDEALRIQEAEKHDINVSEDEIQQGVAQIASQNNFTLEQFAQIIDQQGIPRRTLRNQVKAQIAWGKFVQGFLKPQIQISPEDVDAELARLKKPSDDPKVRDDIVAKIGMERLNRMQERHFQSVKSAAFIETCG